MGATPGSGSAFSERGDLEQAQGVIIMSPLHDQVFEDCKNFDSGADSAPRSTPSTSEADA